MNAFPTIQISELRKHLNTVDAMRHKQKAFAIVSLDYLYSLLETLEILSNPQSLLLLEKSSRDISAGSQHSHESIMQELG